MTISGPRIDIRLFAALERVDDPSLPIAETCRRVGQVARHLGLVKPSYEQIRVLVHDKRRRDHRISTGEVLLDIAYRARPPGDAMEHALGLLPQPRKR